MGQKFLVSGPTKNATNNGAFDIERIMKAHAYRTHSGNLYFSRCSVKGCTETEIQVHHIRKLHRKTKSDGKITIKTVDGKRVSGVAALLSAINRKQLPLCGEHHREIENGKLDSHSLDEEYLKQLNIKVPKDLNIA